MMRELRFHSRLRWGLRRLVLAWVFVIHVAHAQTASEVEQAKRLFAAAEEDQANLRWAEALEKLEQVVMIKDTAGVRFHIAVCQDRLGLPARSLENFERAQQLALSSGSDDVLELVGPEIERLRQRVATLTIEVSSRVVDVRIDRKHYPRVSSKLVVRLDPGDHRVTIQDSGKTVLDRRLSLEAGRTEALFVSHESTMPRERLSSDNHAMTSVRASETPGRTVSTVAWTALGAGAALGIGGYFAFAKADDVAKDSAFVCAHSLRCDPDRVDVVRRWDAAALGMWVGSAVGVGVGLGLILAGQPNQSSTAWVVTPTQLQARTVF
ncbi:MAG TPA: hypothetical protein PKL73_01130 [Polyangiaceae bacterium]|nr:MAG: hypothetical protein BWY17_02559 [Deltaproteobacteria bacterium ADurb.Bin207]HNS95521.1 hypothetical protein [Polyangiaceae bacterium]HNZ23590.1 hypothetical protein [Polyangiaceae bacterium]HOD22712.1 hypothetical protein [Polyangiaceae bacterium]HOE47736.1 hypothetical protein [Polyangiaceae bacterium]